MLLALALSLQDNIKIELLCSAAPFQNVVRYRFTIDPATQSFVGTSNEKYPISGKADLTPEAITLINRGDRTTNTFRISRVSGDLVMDMAVNDQPPARSVSGTCQKYTGTAF